ncbi:plastocyanin/azurin family copper-binding protein [Longibacter sp.]|uniref:plastocyanin/azurin family copper-binding protein n=1 Tax=Longibacter sp. TaxID=2045415 RepID=UPI003EB9D1AD
MRNLLLVFVMSIALIGCGGSGDDTGSSASASSESETASTSVDRTVTITPEGNQMRYAETEFSVAPGETIRLVFDNTATAPSMQHNVVVLNEPPSRDVFQRIGEGGMTAGSANAYVPDDEAILAYTPMSQPGEKVEVVFTAPEETGEYGYVCTFPGHWATMTGTMRVTDSPA